MRYKAKRLKTLLFGGVGQFEPRFQAEGDVPREYFLVSRKLDTFCCLSTDGIAIANTALAMRHCGAL